MADMDALVEAIKEHSGMDDAEIADAGEHGADSGWPGFTYYSGTAEFYDKNQKLIWGLLEETADDQGVKPLELVASFRTEVFDVDSFKNVMAWFALEESGRYLADQEER